jgi:uncharacterized protein with HEPN domain
MPRRAWSFRVRDILDSVGAIEEFTGGMSYDQFAGDRRTVDAVVRNLGIIGEAASHVPVEIQELSPAIEWDGMRRMRNFVIHAYFRVDLPLVWRTIQEDLPPLKAQLNQLLRQAPEHG